MPVVLFFVLALTDAASRNLLLVAVFRGSGLPLVTVGLGRLLDDCAYCSVLILKRASLDEGLVGTGSK